MGFSLVSHYRGKEKEMQASCLEFNSTICSKPNGEGGLREQSVSPGLRSMTQNLADRSQTTAWQRCQCRFCDLSLVRCQRDTLWLPCVPYLSKLVLSLRILH